LGDDGQRWAAEDGRDFGEIVAKYDPDITTYKGLVRYVFTDGSAIVAGSDFWDIEGEDFSETFEEMAREFDIDFFRR